jgi:thiosulfate dehydrogenase
MSKGFAAGFLLALLLVLAGACLFIVAGGLYAGQDVAPGGLERWAARRSLHATLGPALRKLKNPLPPTDDNLAAGAQVYDANCRVCHGGSDGVATSIANGLTPKAPQLAKDGVDDDPVEMSYWKVAHGIRFTGMPAFRGSLAEPQMWQVALFVAHLNALPPRARHLWEMQKAAP